MWFEVISIEWIGPCSAWVFNINAVTAEQVKAMVKKYFDMDKMTVSIVAPVSKLDALKPFTVIPQDSLEFRN